MNTATNPVTDPELRALAIETDTKLAQLDGEYARLSHRYSLLVDTVRGLRREHGTLQRGGRVYPTTADESIAALSAELEAGEVKQWNVENARSVLAELPRVHAKMDANRNECWRLHLVWADNGYWSRFFLVNASNGHIHYDISTHRCSRRPTTEHGWNPELSGLTEAEAVAALGPRLCTTCFPSAPVEWTVGEAKPPRCAGAGKAPVAGTRKRRGMNTYGECSECHTRQIETLNSGIRAHRPQN